MKHPFILILSLLCRVHLVRAAEDLVAWGVHRNGYPKQPHPSEQPHRRTEKTNYPEPKSFLPTA